MSEQFEKIGDVLEGMDLREISRYLEDLRFNLLCHEMADEVDQPVEGNGEAVHHYLSAMSHIELAQHAMKLAWIHNPKRRES
jgi:hypothetical protein